MKKVLLIDDNQLIRRLASIYLNKRGLDVEVCEGPFGALNKAREYRPDIILLDLNMPGLSGASLARILLTHKEQLGYRVLLFSSEDESMQKDLVMAGLADGYFLKNHTFDGLVEAMHELCGVQNTCNNERLT
ncbi:MAG: response regulator [Nitrospirae bacterium]|nr:response regulator [Nitrospirota bacterium]